MLALETPWNLFSLIAPTRPEPERLEEREVQTLVQAVRGGDAHAAGRLYAEYVQRIYRAVRPLCDSEADAEDVVQDVFIKALCQLDRYQQAAGTRFVAWLVTIALNDARSLAVRRLRHARLARHAATLPPPGPAEPDQQLARKRLRQQLLEALATLPQRDREVLCLRFAAELSAPEVAEICGLSADNVRKICERQRARLLELVRDPAAAADREEQAIHAIP